MARRKQHLDDVFADFPYEFGEVSARMVQGKDGRSVLQLRVDMGLLQMETVGRPDGERPHGFDTFLDYLVGLSHHEGEGFMLDEDRCLEVDREFVQFFHRRITWLALREWESAVRDADHTLRLMDFSSAHAPDENWAIMHEQYRPFVLFHRTQAQALVALEDEDPDEAVSLIDAGLERLREVFIEHEVEEEFEEDELVVRLVEMRGSIVEEYHVEPSLTEQLAEAIAAEQYERAAELRDKIAGHDRNL